MGISANFLQYGPIRIGMVRVEDYKREPVYADKEKTHYIYTRHTLLVKGVVSPDNDIDQMVLGPNSTNVIDVDNVIQHFLTTPRLKLIYSVGGQILLESPMRDPSTNAEESVDCNNGPRPLGCSLKRINGMNSAHVEFVIQTDLNEAHLYGAPRYPILSNNYAMEHIIDQDFYTTIKVVGVLHFRSDVLFNNNLSPDDFREIINIPTPVGFKRDLVKCRLHPGSMKMEYSFLDRETHFHIDTRNNAGKGVGALIDNGVDAPYLAPWPNTKNITRIEIKQGITNTTDSIASAISVGGKSLLDAYTGGKLLQMIKVGGAAVSQFIPLNEETLDITIYGNNLSDKRDLEYLAFFIIEKRMPFDISAGRYGFHLEEDLVGSFIRIQVKRYSSAVKVAQKFWTVNNSTLTQTTLDPFTVFTGKKFNLNYLHFKGFMSNDEDIDGVAVKTYKGGQYNDKLNDVTIVSARSGKDQMRGSYLEQIFVEAIRQSPAEFPVDPHDTAKEKYLPGNNKEIHFNV